MYEWRLGSVGLCVALIGIGVVSCERLPTSPSVLRETAPGAATPGDLASATAISMVVSAPDGSTLKVTPPVPQSPQGDSQISGLETTLTASSATGLYVSASLAHEFELVHVTADGTTTLVERGTRTGQGPSVSYSTAVLEQGERFRWRVRGAQDGAVGPWSEWAFFRTPILLRFTTPLPKEPVQGEVVTSLRPLLTLINGGVEGPGVVTYEIQIATDLAFQRIVVARGGVRGTHPTLMHPMPVSSDLAYSHLPDQTTSVKLDVDLDPDTLYYWRARGTSGAVTPRPVGDTQGAVVIGDFSIVETFRTPEAGGGGGDGFDLSQVIWLHHNVSAWPATSTITSIVIGDPPICINHTMAGRWRTRGGLEANPWVFANIGGTWYAGTFEYLRSGQTCKNISARTIGPHVEKPPLEDWVPQSGELVGFMVSGLARAGPDGSQERSQVVFVRWP